MASLRNARHERFAQAIASGKTATESYVIAGYKDNDSNASQMARKPEITDRITEINGRGAERAGVNAERIISELAKLGFANMQDYITVGIDGLPYTDFSKLTREQAAAIAEVHVEMGTTMEMNDEGEREAIPVRKVKLKLHDKRAALVDLGKHLGLFKDAGTNPGALSFTININAAGAGAARPAAALSATLDLPEAASGDLQSRALLDH